MSQPRIVRTLEADRDLDRSFDWIARDGGMDRADAILRRIEDTLLNLAKFPAIGKLRHELDSSPRVFPVWPWLIIYETLPPDEGIIVWRVVDGRRDVGTIIKPP